MTAEKAKYVATRYFLSVAGQRYNEGDPWTGSNDEAAQQVEAGNLKAAGDAPAGASGSGSGASGPTGGATGATGAARR
jgi:hypothetical protein